MKVSIIMPIYNAQKFLRQSLDSLVNQTYKDIEIILVNDGSTDNSKGICREYKLNDKRIKLITIKNSGPGIARNKGIEESIGEYISFVDADDYIALDGIETLLNTSRGKFDVVSSNHFRVDRDIKVSKNLYKTGAISKYGKADEKRRYNLFKTSSSFGYVWGKIYKREFIIKHDIKFSQERKVFLEDTLFNLKVIAYKPKYYVLNTPIYYYNIIDDSLSNKKEDVTDRAIKLLDNYQAFLDKEDIYNENLDLFIPLATRIIAWSLFKTMDYKFSFINLCKGISIISKKNTIRRLFLKTNTLKEIKKLRNIFERLLYSFIVICIKYNLNILLAIAFYISYPIFKIYILRVLKS